MRLFPAICLTIATPFAEYIAVTKKWWDAESQHFDVYVSEETIAELSQGDYPRKTELLTFVAQLQVLPPDDQILEIARLYLDNYLMPRVSRVTRCIWPMQPFTSATFC